MPTDLWIRDKGSVPDGGWQYPSVFGPPVKSADYGQLYGKVKKHYEGNAKEVPTREQITRWLCENLPIPCYEGRNPFPNKFTHPPTFAERGASGPDWPWMILPVKLLAVPEDRGIGDIIARTIGPIGGDAFKRWHLTIFGKSCGCKERQEDWNIRFPL